MSFNDSLLGWPIVAIALTLVAALGSLLGTRQRAHIFLTPPLIIAGLALIVWAIHPANWANCNDYRYWVAPISMLFMSGAAVEELWLRRLPEPQLQNLRLYAVPLIGAIFLLVLSIQSLQWGMMSRRLATDLMNSDRGCVSRFTVASIRNTALEHWAVTFYAVELQGLKPSTLLAPDYPACQLFARNGAAILVDEWNFKYVRYPGKGRFDFEDARSRTAKQRK